ncbi:MAG: c-type cytochrome, partial [Planctomycetaceae bacterium]|nr:c-type cytochrome [Planctomycetaceae bacterium]
GAVYVADWYDGRVAHLLTMEEQVDNTRGRVYRLVPKEGKLDPLTNLQKVSVDQVLEELNHPNRTRRYLARQRLRELEDHSFLAKIDQALKAETAAYPLELFWARHSIKPYTDQELAGFWQHKSAPVREWSVRLACDDGTLQDSESSELSALATGETDVAVRSQILCSARRLPPKQTLSLTLTMLDRESDAQDPHLPLLYWWNVESVISRDPAVLQELIDSDPDQLLNRRLFADLLAENLIRRLVSSREIPLQKLCQSILILGVDQPFAARFVKGFELGLAGRSLVEVPVQLLTAVRELGSLPLPLRLRMNEAAAIDEVLELLAGSQAADKKLPLLQVASEVNEPRLAQAVLHLAQTATAPEVRTAAWLALQGPLGDQLPLSVKSIPSEITSWDSREISAMCHTFSSRVAWARQLVAAVDQGIVNKDLVPADVIRRLSFHQDERLRADVARIWKSVAGLATAEMAATMTRLAGVLDQLEGDPYRGKPLFKQQCGKCHELFEEGEYVGPSLTSYQRTDRTHLLRHIVNPSLEIREGFEVKVVLTDDGRILTGFTTFEDEESLVIRGSEGSDVRVLKEQIEEIIPQPVSLMPAGMLEKLSDQEVADLFSYLQSAQPLNN